jgi:YVTN family beta-propeller protein
MRLKSALLASAISAVLGSTAALGESTSHVSLGNNTAGITADPVLRKVFVTNYNDGTVSSVDVDSMAVETFAAGTNPRRLISNAATHRLYMVNDTAPGSMTVIDETTGQILSTIALGDRPRVIASDFQKAEVYAINQDSNSLSIVDATGNTVAATIPLGVTPTGLDVNTLLGRIYVVSSSDGSVTIIDQASRAIIKKLSVGSTPSDATVDERTGKAYVNNVDDKTVSVIDPSSNEVSATISIGAGSTFGVTSPVYGRYYLPNAMSGTLSIVNTDSDLLVKELDVGAAPQSVQVDSAGGNLYVVDKANNTVTVADARTEVAIGAVPVDIQPWRILLSMNKLFTLNTNGSAVDTLSVSTDVDTQSGTAIATEYYDAGDDEYFHSSNGIEARLIADGLFGETWTRTMQFFRVWTQPGGDRVPMCRFLGTMPGEEGAHVFTPYASECDALKADSAWQFENIAYYVQVPDANGNCSATTEPLYRLYNNGNGGASKHRLTASRSVRDAMVAAGWVAEGQGDDSVFACTPPLAGSATVAIAEKPMHKAA